MWKTFKPETLYMALITKAIKSMYNVHMPIYLKINLKVLVQFEIYYLLNKLKY